MFSAVSHSLLLAKLARYRLDGWSARWVGNWLTGHTQRVMINGFYSGWQPVTSEVPQASIPGPTLFNIFINDLYDGTESTRTKFADHTKLGGEVDTLGGGAVLQRDLDSLEKWASKNCVKFNKDKCQVLQLGHHNQRPQYRLGSVWLGSSLAERDPGVLVDKLNTSQQCAAAATKANLILGCICGDITSRDGDTSVPLSAHQAAPGLPCPALVPTIQKCRQTGEGPKEGHEDDQRAGEPAI